MGRFLHTADWHIGSLRGLKNVTVADKLRRYEASIRAVMDAARQHGVTTVVAAGDIFDSKNVQPKERDVLLRLMVEYSDILWLVINGNHDLLEDDYTSLHFLTILQAKNRLSNVVIAEVHPRVHVVPGEACFILVPFTGSSERFRRAVKSHLREAKATRLPIVVVGHEMVEKCSDDSGWVAEHGVTIPKISDVVYWAFGDIHRRQSLGGLPNAWYPGPPSQHRFSELPEKGCLLVDTDRPNDPRFIRLTHPDVAPLINVEADSVKAARTALSEVDSKAWINLRCPGEVTAKLNSEDVIERTVVKNAPSPRQAKAAAERVTERIALSTADPLKHLERWLVANREYKPERAAIAVKIAREL